MAKFPTAEWVEVFMAKLNGDDQYAKIAKNWEGDIKFIIEPSGTLSNETILYFDLWHGKCRDASMDQDIQTRTSTFTLKAPYENFVSVLKGELHPMQALMTRKLHVEGNMGVLMRNVPTVLDFVRCAREVTDSFI
jgi:putative sterol carrier protein